MSESLALVKKDTVDIVAARVREFQERGELHFPANYSPENAMKSAWLILQEVKTGKESGYKPALEACTKNSIANALLDMVVQGLNPAKKQGYFICYGKNLVFQRSYFGTMAVCKNVTGARDVFAQVVYEGDGFEYELKGPRKVVSTHKQKLQNVNKDKIVAAYCTIEFGDGRPDYTDIMTIDQIKASWEKSKMNPGSKDSTHSKYAEEMCKKTVINRACKAYINSSSDSNLLIESFRRADEESAVSEVAEEIAENANQGEVIDVEPEEPKLNGGLTPSEPEDTYPKEAPPAEEAKETEPDW